MRNMNWLGMPSCEDIGFLVSQSHDRSLSLRERWRVRLHLAMCRYCARFERQLRVLHAAVQMDKQQAPRSVRGG